MTRGGMTRGRIYPSQLEVALLTLPDLAPHYQLMVDRSHDFPAIVGHVELSEARVRDWGGLDSARPEVIALSMRVRELLRAHLGLNPEVAIVPPKTIPRSEGKAVRVVERSSPWASA